MSPYGALATAMVAGSRPASLKSVTVGSPLGSRAPREMPRQQVEFGRRVTRLRIQVPVDAAHRDHRREHETGLVPSEDPWLPYRPPEAASIAQHLRQILDGRASSVA
jgi:hypothetical protein